MDLATELPQLAEALHQRLRGKSPGLFEAAYWEELMLDWAMRDPALKTDLFRLVDAVSPRRYYKIVMYGHLGRFCVNRLSELVCWNLSF